jgi:hypothetical protein
MSSNEVMNTSLGNAGFHLMEAAKHLSVIDVDAAQQVMIFADRVLAMVDVPPQRVTDDRMEELLTDILESED